MIHFNRPCMTGKETEYIRQAVETGKLSGNGEFTHRCQDFFQKRYGFRKCLLTTSCTDALEMAALLTGVGPGDEVIVPSYTFVSSALAFVRTGATIVFADSCADQPNIDAEGIERLITPRTKVIVPVHYAGCACDMDRIMAIAEKHNLLVVEDAAQAVDSWFVVRDSDFAIRDAPRSSLPKSHEPRTASREPRPLGGIGHLAAFSFHETKNITAGGEGGMLVINDERFLRRAEILWEKGTNRAEFFRGEVNKYGWVDIGSSFLPSEINAAYLWAQCENLDVIQTERKRLWQRYYKFFEENFRFQISDGGGRITAGGIALPKIPEHATNNAHMFYLLFPDLASRTDFIAKMRARDILTPFHYLPLHSSQFYQRYSAVRTTNHESRTTLLPNCDRYADTLVRLPLYYGLAPDQDKVLSAIKEVLA